MADGRTGKPQKVLVTGGSGILGRQFVPRLLEAGLEVQSIALDPWPDAPCPHYVCDLESFGETMEALQGFPTVLHLAAVHAEGRRTPATTFHENVVTTFNVFQAAALLGVARVVWASSCHTGGGRWSRSHTPVSVPLSEADHHETGDTYGLSKIVGETIAAHTRAWNGTSFVALRYGYVYAPDEYERVRARWDDAEYWAHSLWNYVDARDAFEVTRRALTSDVSGSHVVYVTAADQSMNVPTRELVAEHLPGTTVHPDLAEYGSLMSLETSRRLFDFVPRHSWREALTVT